MTRVGRGAAAALVAAVVISACVVPRVFGPRLTGTCAGACAHYAGCKDDPEGAEARCARECPDVFSDEDSLRAYESLACEDAVEYVDGPAAAGRPRAAAQRLRINL